MNIKLQRVLRTVSKIILLVVVLGFVVWGGYYVYLSITNKPQNVVITNITDSSATITWTTQSQMNGVVYYKENEKTILPGILAFLGSKVGYDDRDASDAQTACVDEFNKKAGEEVDAEFNVSGEDFDCEGAKVTGMGKYYTHSVTMTNLKPETKYSFVVGGGIWSFKADVTMVTTFDTLEEVDTPMPVFGRIVGDDDTYSRDSLVYITFRDGSEEQDSIVYSSTGNDDGGWYLDAATARDSSGDVLQLELTNDTFKAKGVYKNYGNSDEQIWVLGYFNGAYPDITVEKNVPISMLVGRAYAGCTYQNVYDAAHGTSSLAASCDLSTLTKLEVEKIGYGNVVKAQVASGTNLSNALSNAGLGGGNIATNGNINAIYGTNLDGTVAISEFSRVIKTSSGTAVTGTQTDTKTGKPTIVVCSSSCVESPVNINQGESNVGSGSGGKKTIVGKSDVSHSDSGKETFVLKYDAEASTYSIQTATGTVTNIPSSVVKNIVANEDTVLSTVPVLLYPLVVNGGLDITSIVNSKDPLKNAIYKEIERLREENTEESQQKIENLCDKMGGGDLCPTVSPIESNIIKIPQAHAAETISYAQYLPEYGLYSFQLGDYTLNKETSNGNTIYLFYIEANGQSGFQMPADPDNPTSEEDIILDSSAYEITYKQESSAQQYDVEEGINILSFNFVPVSPNDLGAYMASDLITQAANNGVNIEYISIFSGGRWYSGYSCSSGTCTGTNFSIVPGKGYVVKTSNSGTITIPGYNLTSSVPIPFSSGWNLVGVHGYTTAYTARTFIDSINTVEGLTANNVSWWPTSKGKYEGLQFENNTEYGLDFSISPTNGYFVRISDFEPTDTSCKSILWNAGGTANGICGNTK